MRNEGEEFVSWVPDGTASALERMAELSINTARDRKSIAAVLNIPAVSVNIGNRKVRMWDVVILIGVSALSTLFGNI